MAFSAQQIDRARRHLRKADPVMRRAIESVGPFTLKTARGRFESLARSILAQQISTAAARSIRARLDRLVAPGRVTAKKLVAFDVDTLRSVGISRQKATYLLDLARRADDGRLRLARMSRLSDEEVIDELTEVKGIGHWTAQMFLIFSLGRPDVFPHGDLGIQRAIQQLYGLSSLPDRDTSLRIASPWHPYASVASWYLWRTIDLGLASSPSTT